MKAIFSLCTTYLDEQMPHGGFANDEAFACSCILSVLTARQSMGWAEVYTDERGRRWFEQLGLPFDAVHPLAEGPAYPQQLWMTTKLRTYRAQQAPFLHIDLDAYLWQPLPARLAGAGVICQNSENGYPFYEEGLRYLLEHAGYVPEYVRAYHRQHGYRAEAICAGVYGGHDLATIHYCCDEALRIIAHPANAAMFANLTEQLVSGQNTLLSGMNVILEQLCTGIYFLEHQTDVRYLLPGPEPPYFTHLMASSKRHPVNTANLQTCVADAYPAYYHRAQRARL